MPLVFPTQSDGGDDDDDEEEESETVEEDVEGFLFDTLATTYPHAADALKGLKVRCYRVM